MTQFVDFVALGWVEQNLRGEIEAARKCLYHYQREPNKPAHLKEAERNIHSATSALRLCTLEPAALLSQEIEQVLAMLQAGVPIPDIALRLGYADTTAFHRAFRRWMGTSPEAWLREGADRGT